MELSEIQAKLKSHASPEKAEQMQRVAPGAKNIYGIKMPVLNELAKQIKNGGFNIVQQLWDAGSYEEKLLAAKTLRHIAKQDPDKAIAFVKRFSNGIDNWAVCDTLGMQSLKPVNKIRQTEIFRLAQEFSSSPNMWKRRLSLVLLEDFCKRPELHSQIKKLIALQEGDKEYYMKKAVTWLKSSLNKKR